jgi:ADP-ribosylglycohydrolase
MAMASAAARERALTALEGLSVGDAFGERFIHGGSAAESLIAARSLPPAPWRWTDDTAMALDVLEVLSDRGTIEQDRLAATFVNRWARDPDRGYGPGAFRMLHRIALGETWQHVSRDIFAGGSMGNGAAMRVAPLGAYFATDGWERVASEAQASAEVTHAHPEGIAGAIAVATAAAWASGDRATSLFDVVLDITPASGTRTRIAQAASLPPETVPASAGATLGNGRTVLAQDTVAFCLWCVQRHLDDYANALWATVSALGDCDTTCAIVGGIVACAVGIDGVPAGWRSCREPLS